MLTYSEVMQVKYLQGQGLNVSAIAREMGKDRKTVRKILKGEGKEEKGEREEKESILDPYKAHITAMLVEECGYTAQRLFQEIQKEGYPGGYDLVKRFVGPLLMEKRHQAEVRFETMPGQQAQVDWAGSFGDIVIDGVRKVLSCFSIILGWSRYQYIEFVISRNLVTFLSCHIHAFEYFGFAPKEILYDNLKTAIMSHVMGVVTYQPTFLDFAGYYGFEPRACRPYRAKTKGKVERPFPYIRGNFFLGLKPKDLGELNAQALTWLKETAHERIHGTTRERPKDRFEKEKAFLMPLPDVRYQAVETVSRSSSRDGVISYGGNFYGVPSEHACRRGLRVEVSSSELKIYHEGTEIARHGLCRGQGHRIVDPKHLDGYKAKINATPGELRLEDIRSLGEVARAFVDGLVRTQSKYWPWHLKKLEQILWHMGAERLEKAMSKALEYEAFDARIIENICMKMRGSMAEPAALRQILPEVVAKLAQGEVEDRGLAVYDEIPTQEVS